MSDDFDSILDDCLAETAAGRLTIDDCLKRFPQHADRLAFLLPVASQARAVPIIPPLSVEKRRAIEAQLLSRPARLQDRSIGMARSRGSIRWRRVVAIALIACVIIGTGAVTASANSLPGEVLYPIKRFTENVTVAITPADERAALNVELAERRLDEFSILANRGDIRVELLADVSSFSAEASQAVESLAGDKHMAVLEKLVQFTEKQAAVLASIADRAPASIRPTLEQSMTAAAVKHQYALDLLNNNSESTQTTDPNNRTPTVTATTMTGVPTVPTIIPAATAGAPVTSTLGAPPTAQPTPARKATPPITPPGQAKPKPEHTPPGQGEHPPGDGRGNGNGHGKPKK